MKAKVGRRTTAKTEERVTREKLDVGNVFVFLVLISFKDGLGD